MYPIVSFFGKTITTYFIFSLIGIFVAGTFACKLSKKRGEDDNETIIVMLFASIGAILGGHILYGITNFSLLPILLTAESFSQFLEYIVSIFGGSVFYGGLIGAIISAFITIRFRKLPLNIYSDILATIIPLFHCFGRVGCFLGGCCYGIESHFGFTAHGNMLVPEVNDVSRFPVQLLEAFFNLLLFFVLLYIYNKSLSNKKFQGKILFIYLISYSIIRFCDEFLRGDKIRGFIFGLSTSQFISVWIFFISVSCLIIIKIKSHMHRSVKNEQ